MRSEGAAPGPAAPLCGALSLVLGALLGKVIAARGVADDVQRFSPPPPELPVSFRVLGADAAFLLTAREPAAPRNRSLRARAQAFFAFRAPRPPRLHASYGPFSVERPVPAAERAPGSPWELRARVLRERLSPSRPLVQVLFHVAGRAWAEPAAAERLPCLRLWAFRDAREVRAGCRPAGALGLCVAQLELPPAWFGPAPGGAVELYYAAQPADERGACAGGDPGKANAIRPGKDGAAARPPHLRRIGAVGLHRAREGAALSELRLDADVVVRLPSGPAKPGAVVAAHVAVASDSTVDFFVLRAKVKKGVRILSAQPSEPRHWAVKQEVGNGGKHATATVSCQRLAQAARNRSSSPFSEVVQLNFEITSFSSLSGTQPITWQLEYPGRAPTDVAVSEIFVSQKDLAGIVPLAMDTEILNTAMLTGKTVTLPVRVVSVEESGAVSDISELVECVSTDEDVIKVSDRCDYVFVNGREIRGQVDAAVNFTYQHLSAPLLVTVWAPRLPLQIQVSDTELSQIKGWRVPIVASKRPTQDSEEEEEEEEERRGRGCALQFQRATVRVLTEFVSQGAGPWGQPSHLLGPDWQFDITHLVADFMKLEEPHVATLQAGRVLVGREVGMTTIQVLSPLSDSILAEKTVTVLDDKVSVTDLAIQLVAGLSATLHPDAEDGQAITAVATAEELLRTPKQEAVVSTWLQFSDGSATPVDIYDAKDFSLTATSLDETIVSVAQARSPRWPVVVAEGEGEGPLVRVDLAIAEACQKSKRKSVLAVGFGNVRVKFGQSDADSSPVEDRGGEEEIKNHASGRRQKAQGQDGRLHGSSSLEREEGALWRVPATAKSPVGNRAGKSSRLDGEAQPQNIPLDFTRFPAQGEPPRAGAGPEGGDLVQRPRGLSDLEIGMYALLGVFCLAIVVFLVNCATFALRYRHKQVPVEGQASVPHSHDWVWLGNEAELLENTGEGSTPQHERTTVIDRGLGGHEESSHLPLTGGSQKRVQSQVHRPPAPGAGQEPPHSPTSRRKKVQFSTFTAIPPDDGCPTVDSIGGGHGEDIKWVCPDMVVGGPRDPGDCLEKLKAKA